MCILFCISHSELVTVFCHVHHQKNLTPHLVEELFFIATIEIKTTVYYRTTNKNTFHRYHER